VKEKLGLCKDDLLDMIPTGRRWISWNHTTLHSPAQKILERAWKKTDFKGKL